MTTETATTEATPLTTAQDEPHFGDSKGHDHLAVQVCR